MRFAQIRTIRTALISMTAAASLAFVAGCAQTAGGFSYSGERGAYSERNHPYTDGPSFGYGAANSYPGVY